MFGVNNEYILVSISLSFCNWKAVTSIRRKKLNLTELFKGTVWFKAFCP